MSLFIYILFRNVITHPLCVLLYHAVFYLLKTIGTRENEDNSHSVGKILFES